MNKLSQRLAALSREQRRLLVLQARKRGIDLLVPEPPAAPPATERPLRPHSPRRRRRRGEMRFSLLFFSAAGFATGSDKYRLVLETARFADRHGFEAIWTPERHFQSFGGLYPNPSVLSAALAMVTERLRIRAGSLVLPLHNPIRVAEDWSLLDNLSGGRVGISFASGWNPIDFALSPLSYAPRRELMFEGIELIRRLWAGEQVRVPGVDGDEVAVTVLPRPVQAELPIWVTSSGSPETWVRAGEMDTHVLTAVHGDPSTDLAERVDRYRRARRERGLDPDAGRVTAMVHTFLGDDRDRVRETVREPMTRYLRAFIAQGRELDLKPLGLDPEKVVDRDLDDLAAFAFEHYFRFRSLLGTPETCAETVRLLRQAGVDELACLVDFGLEPEVILAGLEHLETLRCRVLEEERAAASAVAPDGGGER